MRSWPGASLIGTGCSPAYAAAHWRSAIAAARRPPLIARLGSRGGDRQRAHDIVVIARRVEDQALDLGLADGVAGLCRDHVFSRRLRREFVGPTAKREAAEIRPEFRRLPDIAAVSQDFDTADAVARIPGDACDFHNLTDAHLLAIGGGGNQRVHHYLGDRLIVIGHLREEMLYYRKL